MCGHKGALCFARAMLNKAAPDEPAAAAAAATAAAAAAPLTTAHHLQHYGATVPVPVPLPLNVSVPSINAFSALHLLRNYNQLLMPPADIGQRYRHLITQNCLADEYKVQTGGMSPVPTGNFNLSSHQPASSLLTPHSLLAYQPVAPLFGTAVPPATESPLSPILGRTIVGSSSPRRQRGEKKPIPDDQKDEKYFERRRRNNQAAKKSRDARKMREDQIAFRATMLEHENAILRAQILTLREEATSLRQMLITKKTDQTQSICR